MPHYIFRSIKCWNVFQTFCERRPHRGIFGEKLVIDLFNIVDHATVSYLGLMPIRPENQTKPPRTDAHLYISGISCSNPVYRCLSLSFGPMNCYSIILTNEPYFHFNQINTSQHHTLKPDNVMSSIPEHLCLSDSIKRTSAFI